MLRILLLACGLVGSVAAIGAPLPIEQFTRFDEFGTIKISPDGQYLAMTTGKHGRSVIAFIDLSGKQPLTGVRAPDPLQIRDFDWISNTRLVYSILERWPGLKTPHGTGELFAINRDGSRHEQIYGYRAGQSQLGTHMKVRDASFGSVDLITALRGDAQHILVAEYPWRQKGSTWYFNPDARPNVLRLDVFSGDKDSLGSVPLRNAQVLVDHDDQVRFGLGLDDEFKLAVVWKPDARGAWQEFRLPGFREEGLAPQRFSADNKSVLLTGVREGESFAALYRLDLQTHALEKLYGFDGAEVSDLITDFADRDVVGVLAHADRTLHHWFVDDDPAAKLYKALYRAFAGQHVTVTSTTDDGRLAIVFVDSDTNPGEYYLFDTKAMKAEFLRAGRKWIDPTLMRPMEPVQITARDGLKLPGYLTKPVGDAPHPLVLLPHGGPHGVRDTWGFDWEVQLLANRGYAVLQVNYRGSSGYGMDFEAAGYRQWGARMQDDLTDATRWAIEQKVAAADRICVFGSSYGAFAALMGAAREPDLYRCAIGYAGIYDLELMFTSADIPDSRSGMSYLRTVLGDDAADLRARSPVHNAERIKSPVMLIHGTADWRADFEQAERMKAALEKHGKPLEWVKVKHEGHGVYDEETRREVYEQILAFLDKHLMVGTSAPVH
jgi:dipeptidyl aminopeptidase/acylaminoacyl peptidase